MKHVTTKLAIVFSLILFFFGTFTGYIIGCTRTHTTYMRFLIDNNLARYIVDERTGKTEFKIGKYHD